MSALLTSLDPRDGSVLAEYPIAGEAEVTAAVDRAADAARWWAEQGFAGRREWLLDYKAAIARGAEELAALISAETGKPREDALLEVMLAVEHLDWAARNAGKVLGRRSVPAGVLGSNQKATVGYRPYGVVGVIGPWNYPVFTPMGSIAYALAAGNAVVFKPSELTPGVGRWLAETFASLAPVAPVLQTIVGDGGTGAALCRSAIGKLAFTGSTATAKKVMAACAENLTPVVAECGGKDAMIIDADADLDAAARFAVFGGLGNAGQTCVGVERIYVHQMVAEDFIARLVELAARVRVGVTDADDYGPMTLPGQADLVRGQVDQALAAGARARLGGAGSVDGDRISPIVLTDVPEDQPAVTEETFGPLIVVQPVRDMDEAVAAANSSRYGLAASVFTRDRRAGAALAERLEVGVVTVGSVLGFAAIAALPMGGVKDSGFGRIHGADGLREFATASSITVQRFAAPLDLLTLKRRARDMRLATAALRLRHGRRR